MPRPKSDHPAPVPSARFPGDRRALAAALGLGERTLDRRLGALDG